ncbi:tyrosine N-monooxygenase-like [Phoenix dactylifera]|uniref:Tyrosine N-monooxygenase-like n=1 Tax=Phoenix dactylifera TaxID=42345 RepID=A0A8B8ZJG7_PHODC|nr:tyrosine N-monooxygenase-like [Phoenix dactylifera]
MAFTTLLDSSVMAMPAPPAVSILPILALLFVASLSFFFLRRRAWDRAAPPKGRRLPPGPAPWPIVGSLPTMLRHKPPFRWILGVAEGKDIICIRLGGVHVVVVNSPDLGLEFLRKHDATFASRPLTMSSGHLGRGFVSVGVAPWGEQWKKMRRVVASELVSLSRLRWQSSARNEEADHVVKYVYNLCKAGVATIALRPVARYYCGNVVRRMVFGVRHFGEGGEYGGPGKEEVEYMETVFTVLSLIFALYAPDFMPSLRWLDVGGHEKMMKEAMSLIYKFHDPIIEERMERWRGGKETEVGGKKREVKDLLDILITLKDNEGRPLLTAEEIKAQISELLFASVDNPSNVAEWGLAELLNQPRLLQKAMDELDRVVGKDRLVQESDIAQLPYIKACAREVLRLHPVSPFNLPHEPIEDATVAGYFIPKGSRILLSRVGLGRNPKVWDDPLRFDPDRHMTDGPVEVDLAEPELRFISFSIGRRSCMGAPLGSAMTVMLLARLLQAFDWGLPPGKSNIDLSEEKNSLLMMKPLRVCARPRLLLLENL